MPVFIATWCRTVGTTWTLELREPDRGTLAGQPVDWICSGVPITLPAPDGLAEDLLVERGLLLHRDAAAPAGDTAPPLRGAIGHVTAEPEVLRLARLVDEAGAGGAQHPVELAAQWIGAGFSVDAACGWITAGVLRYQVAQTLISGELDAQRAGEEGSSAVLTRRAP